jgi:hypothetical protein
MLLENTEATEGEDPIIHLMKESLSKIEEDSEFESNSIQDDVERLIHIAAQLFSAIERQIRHIEEDLMSSSGLKVSKGGQTVFKEQLIQTVRALDASLQEIALHLGQRGIETSGSSMNRQSRFLDYF